MVGHGSPEECACLAVIFHALGISRHTHTGGADKTHASVLLVYSIEVAVGTDAVHLSVGSRGKTHYVEFAVEGAYYIVAEVLAVESRPVLTRKVLIVDNSINLVVEGREALHRRYAPVVDLSAVGVHEPHSFGGV